MFFNAQECHGRIESGRVAGFAVRVVQETLVEVCGASDVELAGVKPQEVDYGAVGNLLGNARADSIERGNCMMADADQPLGALRLPFDELRAFGSELDAPWFIALSGFAPVLPAAGHEQA